MDIKFSRFRYFILILAFIKILIFFNKTLYFLNVKLFFLSSEISIDYLSKVEVSIIKIKEVIASLIIKDLIDIGIILGIKKILFIGEIDALISLIIKDLVDIEIALEIKKVLFIKTIVIISNFLKIFFGYAKVLF